MENINIDELENMSTRSMTDQELNYVQIKEGIFDIEQKLLEFNKQLCCLVSMISNTMFVLNDLNDNLKL